MRLSTAALSIASLVTLSLHASAHAAAPAHRAADTKVAATAKPSAGPHAAAPAAEEKTTPDPLFRPGTFSGLAFRSIGPAVTSGRVGDVAVDPVHPDTWFVAAASGGVW